MAKMIPSFITGATAKIKAGGLTFAYAQDVSVRVNVDTIPVETMGRYETVSNEPVNYSVSGELAVVRYTAIAATNGIPGTNANGNGLGAANWKTGGKGSDQFDPGNLITSMTWDLQVYQKTAAGFDGKISDSTNKVWVVTDCRFSNKTAGLNKRGILVDRMSFVGILASDDSFTASNSGDTDLS